MIRNVWTRWSIVLGVALGGFFDGILLHQILQWHHLLSLVPGVTSLRAQVLWDGYFHALMYVIAAIGVWGLWRNRREPAAQSGALAGGLLIGFGLWHLLDAVLSHWLLGIHRIRLDSPNPLAWDLGWAVGFGVLPVILGWLLLRRPPALGKPRGTSVALLMVGGLATGLAGWSLRPPPGQPFAVVVFAPWQHPAASLNAVIESDARVVWSEPGMGVVVLDVPPANRAAFYRRGALLVSGSGVPAGCFGWSKA